jgi:hypothetical protein
LSRGGRYKAFENHSKILLLASAARDTWITVEGSANLNANPRFEQYVLTNDRWLWEFHRGWMEEVFVTPTKDYRSTTTPRESPQGLVVRRAGENVLAVAGDVHTRRHVHRLKAAPLADPEALAKLAVAVAALIAHHFPVLPDRACITCPPQGATWPREHFAESLATRVATILGLPFVALLKRAAPASPFVLTRTPEGPVFVVDDLITTGATIRQTLDTLVSSGATARGFAYHAS